MRDMALMYHRLVETFKFAYAMRSRLGDEDYVNVTEVIWNSFTTALTADLFHPNFISFSV